MTTNIIFPAPGAPNSFQLTDTFCSTGVSQIGGLSIYNASPTETDSPTYINCQYNVAYDTASWYLNDYYTEVLTKTIRTPVITQTIYFNNTNKDGTIKYRKNTDIKITYLETGFSKNITVKDSNQIGITFEIYDGFPIVNTSGLRLVNITSDIFPSNIRLLSSPTNFPPPGASSATRWYYNFNDVSPVDGNQPVLSHFNYFDYETGTPVYVNSQYNVAYDVVNWYIQDADIITSSVKSVSGTQTLFLNNVLNDSLRFVPNQTINISYSVTGFSANVQIINASTISITFAIVNGFPVVNQGALRIVNVTMDAYPRSLAQSQTIAKGKLTTASNPRENLAVAETLPNYRGITYFNTRPVFNFGSSLTVSLLNSYSSLSIIGDYNFPLTGQSLDVDTTNTNAVSWYINDSDILTYTSTARLVKTVYFATQLTVPFVTGSSVRIRNTALNYSRTFTVVSGSVNSVVLDVDDAFPTEGTYIDNYSSSVYRQVDVHPKLAPTNPRENLFYSVLAPGLKSAFHEKLGDTISTNNITSASLHKPLLRLRADNTSLQQYKETKFKSTATHVMPTPVLSSLPKSIIRLKESSPQPILSFLNKPVLSVKSVVAGTNVPNLVTTFKVTKTTISDISLPLTITSLTKVTRTLKADTNVLLSGSGLTTKLTVKNTSIHETPVAATSGAARLKVQSNTIDLNSGIIKNYFNQAFVSIDHVPSNPREVLFYALMASGKYGSPKYVSLVETPQILTYGSPSSTPSSVIKYTWRNFVGFGNNTAPYALNNFTNVLESTSYLVTGQSSVYDIISWYIYENQIVQKSTPTVGLVQTLYFNNPTVSAIFFVNNYASISQASSGYTTIVKITAATMNSISFATVNGFPSDISNMTITSASNPVYSRALVSLQMMPNGVVRNTTLPRENLFAAENLPNLRGIRVGNIWSLFGLSNNVTHNRLEVFQNSILVGDDRLRVTNQSSDVNTVSVNTAQWYTYDNDILVSSTSTASIKTLYFDTQLVVPFRAGTTVRLISNITSTTVTVITGSVNSISFAQPATPLSIDNLFIENITSTVYPTSKVSTVVAPTNPRERLYYSVIRPYGTLGSIGTTPSTLSIGSTTKAIVSIKGDSNRFVASSLKSAVKVTADPSNIKVSTTKLLLKVSPSEKTLDLSGYLSKAIEKLTATSSYPSSSVSSTSTTSTVIWNTNPVQISGIRGFSTTPSVPVWYEMDKDLIQSTYTPTAYAVLYTGSLIYDIGDRIRILQPNASYDRTFSIVSTTNTSVTILDPGNLPSISGMYFLSGRPGVIQSVTVTNDNSVPIVKSFKQFQTQMFEVPLSSGVKPITKIKSDATTLNAGNLSKQSIKLVAVDKNPKAVTTTVISTPTVTWYNDPIFISGVSGSNTSPSVSDWYAFDERYNVITQTISNSTYITFYFSINQINKATGDRIRLLQPNVGFSRVFVPVSYTSDSITILNPGDIPSIAGMYLLWGRASSTISVSSTSDDSIAIVKTFKPRATLFDTPQSSSIRKQQLTLTSEPSKIAVNSTKLLLKVIAEPAKLSTDTAKLPYKVISVEKQYPSVTVASSTSTTTVKWSDMIVPITGINTMSTAPSISRWYEFDEIYNTFNTSLSNPANITLYFGPTLNIVYGSVIRILQPNAGYDKILPIVSFTASSVTIANPGDLPSIAGMYTLWGQPSTSTAFTFTNNNSLPVLTKTKIVKITDTSYVSPVAKVVNVPALRGEPTSFTVKSRLETYNNAGFTSGVVTTAVQSYDTYIPITGIASQATNNAVSWYTYDNDIFVNTPIAATPTVTLYFNNLTTYTIGSTITLINYTTKYYNVVPVISSTVDSVTISISANVLTISNLAIYINSTVIVPAYANNGFSDYIKVSTNASTTVAVLPVISRNATTITYVKSSYFDTTISPTTNVYIEDASPSVYPFWQTSTTTSTAHDRYLKTLRVSASPAYNRPQTLNASSINHLLANGKASALTKVAAMQAYINTPIASTTFKSSISWSSVQLTVIARSGISTVPSVANWYIRDELYDIISVYNSPSNTITLTYTGATSAVNFTKVRIVQSIASYDKIINIISATDSTITIATPADFPSITNMYMYVGVPNTIESFSYTNTDLTQSITKSPSPRLTSVITPEVAKLKTSFVIKGDSIVIKPDTKITKFKSASVSNSVFETPKVSVSSLSYQVRSVVSNFTVSKLKSAAILLKGDPANLEAKRLEIFENVNGVVENLTTIISYYDTSILISGRQSKYTNNVPLWYINEYDVLSLSPVSLPSNITLSFVNPNNLPIGSTVTLVDYYTNYINTVPVLSSTPNSITIANTNIPDSDLYIYFNTTITFAPRSPLSFGVGTKATILIPGGTPTSITVTDSTATSVSFVRSSTFSIVNGVSTLYNSNPSYFPQSLVFNPNRPPINPRENLFYGLISPTLRYAQPNKAASVPDAKPTVGKVSQTFRVKDISPTYKTNELKTVTDTTYTKWSDSIPITGSNLNFANTLPWYINDYDKLSVYNTNWSTIILYFDATSPTLPVIPNNRLTVRLIQDNVNYYQIVTVISRTNSSMVIVNPGNLPVISNMRMQWGYPAITSSYTYTSTANTITSLDKLTLLNYHQTVYTPASGSLRQMFKIAADNTKVITDKLKSISIRNNTVLDIPAISSTMLKLNMREAKTNLDINGILPRVYNANNIYSLSDYFVNQATVLPRTAPTTPREYLYYSVLAKGKYGVSTDNRNMSGIALPETSGKLKRYDTQLDYQANPDLFIKLFPNGIVGYGSGVTYKLKESLGDTPKLPNPYLLNNYFNIPTTISAVAYSQSNYDVLKWYLYDHFDVISTTVSSNGLTQTLYFINNTTGRLFSATDVITISQKSSGFSVTATVIDATMTSITVAKINNYPAGEITISSLTYPVYSRDYTTSQMLPKGIVRETTLPRENLFAAENLPNLRGKSYFRVNILGGLEIPKSNRLEIYENTPTAGDFKLQVRLQSADYTTSIDTASWYINDTDVLNDHLTPAVYKTLYFDMQDIAPFKAGSTVKITVNSKGYSKLVTVIAGTPNSIVIAQPSMTFSVDDNLCIERTYASVYQQSAVATIGPATNARENLYYSNIRPLSKSQFAIGYDTTRFTTESLRNAVPRLTSDTNIYVTNSTRIAIKVNAEPNLMVSGKVVRPIVVKDVESYPSNEVATRTTTTEFKWNSTPVFVTGISGRSTNPSIPSWYTFDEKYNTLSVFDTNATYVTLYLGSTNVQYYGSVIRLIQLNANYDRMFQVVSSTADSITILNPRDLPNVSNMYFMWGRNVSTTAVTFTNNNRTPLINIVKSISTYVYELPKQLSTLSKQLVKLVNDTNTFKVSTGVSIYKLKADSSFLNTKTIPVVPAVTKGVNLQFNDTTRIMVSSRGQISKFVTSNYTSIMSAGPVQKKETIQFWN